MRPNPRRLSQAVTLPPTLLIGPNSGGWVDQQTSEMEEIAQGGRQVVIHGGTSGISWSGAYGDTSSAMTHVDQNQDHTATLMYPSSGTDMGLTGFTGTQPVKTAYAIAISAPHHGNEQSDWSSLLGVLVGGFALSSLAAGAISGPSGFPLTAEQPYLLSSAPITFVSSEQRPLNTERVARDLHQALQQEPIHDGFNHPAERILMQAFAAQPEQAAAWVFNCLDKRPESSTSADILRLLCRFTPYTSAWRGQIVRVALRSTSVEVRDAAMQAVESWAEPELVGVLRSHTETEKWLADYAAQIICDLRG